MAACVSGECVQQVRTVATVAPAASECVLLMCLLEELLLVSRTPIDQKHREHCLLICVFFVVVDFEKSESRQQFAATVAQPQE